jgi:hypothetical protein
MNPNEERISDHVAELILATGQQNYDFLIRNMRLHPKLYRGLEFDLLGVCVKSNRVDCYETKIAGKAKKLKKFKAQIHSRVQLELFSYVIGVLEGDGIPEPDWLYYTGEGIQPAEHNFELSTKVTKSSISFWKILDTYIRVWETERRPIIFCGEPNLYWIPNAV